MYLRTYSTTVQYSTVQFCCTYMCSKQEHKADHGHKKGHSPRAQEGHSSTGISRPRTEVLRTRAYFSAANTLLRSRASRGHPNLYPLSQMEFGGSLVVVVFLCTYRRTYSTTVQFCCTCAVNKNTRRTTGTRRDTHHGHKKGAHSRASQGRALRC